MSGRAILRWFLIATAAYAGFCAIWVTAGMALERGRIQRINVRATSALAADYSTDTHAALQPPLQPGVIDAAAADNASVAVTPTPVDPAFDPLPVLERSAATATASATPTAGAQATAVFTRTSVPTATSTPDERETPRPIPSVTTQPSSTPEPTTTPQPTNTMQPEPTATKTPICVEWSGGPVPDNNKRKRCTPTPTMTPPATATRTPTPAVSDTN